MALPVKRFPLVRYFALASLSCMVLIAVPMALVLHDYSHRSLQKIAAERNISAAEFYGNSLWNGYRAFFERAGNRPTEELQSAPETLALHRKVTEYSRDTGVVKVNIFDLTGRTIYSSDPKAIGDMRATDEGLLAAIRGKVASELTHVNTFEAFDERVEDRDILSSFIPLEENAKVRAVFEIYSDVTPFVGQMKDLRLMVALTIGGAILMLYLTLSFLIWRAKKIIDRQQAALDNSFAELEAAYQTLESRVGERTQELTDTNFRLTREISERLRAESDLRLAATVFENTGEGVVIVDPQQRVLAVNRAFTNITGYTSEEAVGKTPRMLQSGRQDKVFYRALWENLNRTGNWTGEIWNRRKDGEIYPEWLSISAVKGSKGDTTHFVGVFSDITSIKRSQERLEYMAHHDHLTGLPNRLMLNNCIANAIERCEVDGGSFAVLFIDLDHFKNVNDTLGHSLGDKLLVAVSATLQRCMGGSDAVARVGGDEFVTVLQAIDGSEAAAVAARRILNEISSPFHIDDHELYVGASIGIVLYPSDGRDQTTLLSNADIAMYQAKARGRSGYHFYGPEMTENARERFAMETVLRHSITRDQMFLLYQPQVDMRNGRIVGVEALVRWRHPHLGVVGPSKFVPLAEDCGFIDELGEWVLREACTAMARWRERGNLIPRIAINVSVSQLQRSALPEILRTVLRETGVPPEVIEIEITESVIMNADDAIEKLLELREIGVSLSIDDFGTGYSSLSYLHKLPIQKLKIDRSFFSENATKKDRTAIVQTIIGLANSLGLSTVAEGVECDSHLGLLQQQGCHVVQGFLFGKPMEEPSLLEYCREAA